MPVVVLNAPYGKSSTSPGRRVSVVKAKNPIAVPIMQRQRIADSVRHLRRGLAGMSLDLHPVAACLYQDFAIDAALLSALPWTQGMLPCSRFAGGSSSLKRPYLAQLVSSATRHLRSGRTRHRVLPGADADCLELEPE